MLDRYYNILYWVISFYVTMQSIIKILLIFTFMSKIVGYNIKYTRCNKKLLNDHFDQNINNFTKIHIT